MARTPTAPARREPAPEAPSQPAAAATPADPTSAHLLVPRFLRESAPGRWLLRPADERRDLVVLAGLAALVFFPYLGAVGFWDPWEPHYGEVAREMIQRGDYVHPYWESAWFFSKPILSLWLMAAGMLASGANDPARGISVSTEWWVRSIFALVAVAGVLGTYLAAARTMSRRAGFWAAFILLTAPLYCLLARQAMVDMPFVAIETLAIACLMIAVFAKERVQDGWLYAFYALCGLATLAKGLLGIALPGAAMLGYLLLTNDWHLLRRLRLVTGPLVTLLVAAPWYAAMIAFRGVDDESKTFFERFIIHDHFKRMGFDPTRREFVGGVHTTTPNTTWVYFPEQFGFGFFPWIAAIPGVFATMLQRGEARAHGEAAFADPAERSRRARLFVVAWAITSFCVFGFAATKFHHYVFPMLPPMAILTALFVDKVLDEGVGAHSVALILGGVLFGLVAQNLAMTPKHLADLFVYNYERPYPAREVDPRVVFSALFTAAPAVALLGAPALRGWFSRKPVREDRADRLWIVGAFAALALVLAVYLSAVHWRRLSPHWSQRDIAWVYHRESAPDEPLAAYQMNWRGETFYTRNLVRQLKEPGEIRDFAAATPGRKWVAVEHGRLASLKTALGTRYKVRTVDKTSNKFALVVVEDTGADTSASPPPAGADDVPASFGAPR